MPQGAFQITSREALGFIVFILIMPFPVAKLDGSDLPASITAYTKVRPENYSSISELLLFMFADSYIPWTASATYSGRNPAADRAAGGICRIYESSYKRICNSEIDLIFLLRIGSLTQN